MCCFGHLSADFAQGLHVSYDSSTNNHMIVYLVMDTHNFTDLCVVITTLPVVHTSA